MENFNWEANDNEKFMRFFKPKHNTVLLLICDLFKYDLAVGDALLSQLTSVKVVVDT